MRWLSCFALSLYLSLLCTPQAFAVHDARLSPLADTQFHAVTPAFSDVSAHSEQDSTDEPPSLLSATKRTIAPLAGLARYFNHNITATAIWLGTIQARAPPYISTHL